MADRKVFADSVTPLPPQEGLAPNGLMVNATSAQHREESMTLLFSLSIPADAQKNLEERVARGEVVPIDELQKRYVPAKAKVKSLVDWLKKQGYKIEKVSGDGTSVYARATVD